MSGERKFSNKRVMHSAHEVSTENTRRYVGSVEFLIVSPLLASPPNVFGICLALSIGNGCLELLLALRTTFNYE